MRRRTRRRTPGVAAPIIGVSSFRADLPHHMTPKIGNLNGQANTPFDAQNWYTKVELSIKPSNIVGLKARQFMYNMYRILDVEWLFKRGDHAKHQTGPISARYMYVDAMAIMPNNSNEEIPAQGGQYNVNQMINWMAQNKGQRISLNRLTAKLKLKAKVVQMNSYEDANNTGETEQATTKNMPWMELNVAKMDTMSLGHCTAVIPALEVKTFFNIFADNATQNGAPGSTIAEIAEMYRYEVYCKVRWQVKGKFIEPASSVYLDEHVEEGEDVVDMGTLCDQMKQMSI